MIVAANFLITVIINSVSCSINEFVVSQGINLSAESQKIISNKPNQLEALSLSKYKETINIHMHSKEDINDIVSSTKIKEGEKEIEKQNSKDLKNDRNPIKLTMKQGLIMNQVISTYSLSEVKNQACRDHVSEFKIGLRAFEPWALKMFDSSSKLMPGILNGNLAEMGSFRPCIHIYKETPYGAVKGRHCSLKILPTDRLLEIILSYKNVSKTRFHLLKKNVMDGVQLTWSVCVPHSCSHFDVLNHFNKIIQETTHGLNLTVILKNEHCVSIDDLPDFTMGDYIFVFVVGLTVTMVLVCTMMQIVCKEESSNLVDIFSVKSNWYLLISTKSRSDDIRCLHGLKFLSMCYILTGHRFIHNMAGPVANSMDLVDWLQDYFSTAIFGGTTSVDTFFVVSSTLLSYNFFLTVQKTNSFNIFMFYLLRNLRMLAPLSLAVGAYCTVIKHFGSGPFYKDFIRSFQEPCKLFWWSTLLHIQGLVNSDYLCVVQTWYLSVDMFWYYMSPLILIPIWKNKILGMIVFVVAYILSVLINFYFSWNMKFDGSMPVTPNLLETDYFAHFYVKPYVRGAPYILGLGFGYVLYRNKGKKVKLGFCSTALSWTITVLIMVSTILISHVFHDENFVYNRVFSSLFISLHRSVWTICLMWIIWSCENGYGGIANLVLSSNLLKILARLGYTIFLFHYFIQGAMQNSQKLPGYFSNFLSIYMACADLVLMISLCTLISLCFEYPFLRMVNIFVKKREGHSQSMKIHPLTKNEIEV